ncbi:hypothetical protein NPIL_628841 [Nephila pilipes]|uniref:DUF4371 domain-containing protein n=1 Tax=Nephila pilipes TaxID=299642 RepID=A0A8X6QMB9_NEPPI|nr:hypothetical protein NPIL_628841 [Nephila pilipes]
MQVQYSSGDIRKEFLSLCVQTVIDHTLCVNAIRTSKYFSIIVDVISDEAHTEYICFVYWYKEERSYCYEIGQSFLGYIYSEEKTNALSKMIQETMKSQNLSLDGCPALGSDVSDSEAYWRKSQMWPYCAKQGRVKILSDATENTESLTRDLTTVLSSSISPIQKDIPKKMGAQSEFTVSRIRRPHRTFECDNDKNTAENKENFISNVFNLITKK